ncbi:MAG: PocR ligand-binding domain-containing protein [Bacteroidia bacterium]|nr:PocR ligand-binding domain-containing protein [Bacteroidia bacterium]
MKTTPDIKNSNNDVTNDIQFSDIFNLVDIQRLQDLFSDATGVASIITHPDGVPITKISNSCRLCNNIIRKTKKGLANCYQSDAVLGRHNSSGPIVQPCLSGGLWDAGSSISVGGKHIANWLIGQVRNEELDEKRMIQYADEIGADRSDFMEALKEVPVMSVEQFNKVSKMLFEFANELSAKAYSNSQLKMQIAEREKETEQLRETEERYRMLFEQSDDAIFLVDIATGNYLDANRSAEILTGKSRNELKSLKTSDLTPKGANERLERLLGTNEALLMGEVEYVRPDGAIRTTLLNTIPLSKEHVFGIARDITERKQLDEALKNSLALTEATIESIHSGILVVNNQGMVIKTNAKFAEMWHIPVDILASGDDKTLLDSILGQLTDPVEFIATVSELYAKPEAQSLDLIYFKDGRIFKRISRPLLFGGEPKGRVWSFLDITERKLAEQMLINANKELLFQNEEKEKRAAELIIANKELAIQNEEKEKRAAALIIANKELVFQNEEKEKRAAELFIANKELLFQNKEKEKRAAELIIANDHAEESDNLKTAFLNNISHEIRTPFNGILGFLSLIQEDDMTAGEKDEYIRIINKSAFRLMNTINDIVEISQIQAGQTKLSVSETNIRSLISGVYNHFKGDAESKGLKFFINNDLPTNIDCIYTDSTKLNTILTILIGNAIKFTNTGSIVFDIKIGSTPPAEGSSTGKANAEGGVGEHCREKACIVSTPTKLEFSVKDTGISIPENKQQAIFERFMQGDGSNTRLFEGSGIGLSIAKAYVEMLGGSIWVKSEEGKGAEFYFTIPCNYEPPEKNVLKKIKLADLDEYMPIKPLKILIAEDDEISGKLIEIAVKIFGTEVLKARTGIKAVEICRNNPDIDFVLMDIKMPEMDGYEATKQIRKFNTDVVIIAQTSHALIGDKEKALAAGCNDYISKPFSQASLTTLMKKHLKNQEKG